MTDHPVTAKQEAAEVREASSVLTRAGAAVSQEPPTARKQSFLANEQDTTADSSAAAADIADRRGATSATASIVGISVAAESKKDAKRALLSSNPVNAAAYNGVMLP